MIILMSKVIILPANISADMFPNAKNVTPAMFWDSPRVFDIIKRAGQRLC